MDIVNRGDGRRSSTAPNKILKVKNKNLLNIITENITVSSGEHSSSSHRIRKRTRGYLDRGALPKLS